ncbi:unknown [Bacteroides stercoris CAG:120]|jgi:hypothetical protein|nr:unknown [Bacteroides stercoris CAG:120]
MTRMTETLPELTYRYSNFEACNHRSNSLYRIC